ncbi:MAG: peptidylprolyl isomerase [Myxococcota bacterium]|jgi:parvulin-like peptidyl-prolyl isomerase
MMGFLRNAIRGPIPAAVLVLAAIYGAAWGGEKKSVDGIAAIVNGDPILKSEVAERAKPLIARLEGSSPVMREREEARITGEALNSIIVDRLIKAQLAELKIEVTDKEVDASIEDVKRQRNLDGAALKAAVEAEGISYADYREVVKGHLIKSKLYAIRIRPRVKVTEEDAKNWYAQNVNALSTSGGVQLSVIFVPFPKDATEDQIKELRKRAGAAYARVMGGQEFSIVASEVSADPSAKSGGDLGMVRRGMLQPELERVIFGLKEGQTGEPVETTAGVYIFKAGKVTTGQVRPFTEVRDEIMRRLMEEEGERQFKSWLEEVRRDAHIDIKAKQPEIK